MAKADRKNVWFKLFINRITIKGSRVTLDNGGTKVHMNLNNLDAPSRYSAMAGSGYVTLNTYYAASLFGMSDTPVKREAKDYRTPKVEVVVTHEGPSIKLKDKEIELSVQALEKQSFDSLEKQSFDSFERGWTKAYNELSGGVTTPVAKKATKTNRSERSEDRPSYIETQFLASKGVVAIAA